MNQIKIITEEEARASNKFNKLILDKINEIIVAVNENQKEWD